MLRSLIILTLTAIAAVPAWGQSNVPQDHEWSLKYGVGGAFFNNFSMEIERDWGAKTAFTFRGAITNPIVRTDTAGADGFFLKAGLKFYLGEGHEGFAVKPEAVYTHRRDRNMRIRGNRGEFWEDSFGVILNLSYSWIIKDIIVIEPHLGIGFIPTFETYTSVDDVTFEVSTIRFVYLEAYEKRKYYNSHIALTGNLALSAGLNLGIKF